MASSRRSRGNVQESVYDLIPRDPESVAKPPMYRSIYPAESPPTSSTFGRVVGAQTGVTNLGGDYHDEPRVHRHKLETSTFGPSTEHFANTREFLQKHSRPELPAPRSFQRSPPKGRTDLVKKPSLPVEATKPTESKSPIATREVKNFIRDNAVNVITAPAKKPIDRDVNWLTKPGFGESPTYLKKVKDEIDDERNYIRSVLVAEREREMTAQPKMRLLEEKERLELLAGLKAKWDAVNKQYQTCTHIVTLDTIGKVRRKEQYEVQLHQLERAMEKLSKKYVFVGEE